jgi:hypothetical protein
LSLSRPVSEAVCLPGAIIQLEERTWGPRRLVNKRLAGFTIARI